MAKWEIPIIKIYFGEIDEISKQLGQLQTYKLFEGDDEVLVDVNEVMRILAGHVKVTTAEPERKTGNWNIIHGNIVVCSECGMAALETMTGCLANRHLEPNRTNFCPHCGAIMEG